MCDGHLEKSCSEPLDARARLRLRLRAAEPATLAMETKDLLEGHQLFSEAPELAARADQPSCDAR